MLCFDDEAAAARAYDRKAVEYFGEFARRNLDSMTGYLRQILSGVRNQVLGRRKIPS